MLDPARPTVFAPVGLGVLDLAVGYRIYEWAREAGSLLEVGEFFGETSRW